MLATMMANTPSLGLSLNPQVGSSGSNSTGSASGETSSRKMDGSVGISANALASMTNRKSYQKSLPPLFLYMETGDWQRASERAKRHPREVKAWASIQSKSGSAPTSGKSSGAKRLALHHACFKLRHSVNNYDPASGSTDPFIEICKFILLVLEMHPEAASTRESRHGCLPLHLAAFASCTLPPSKPGAQASSPRSTATIPRPSAIRQSLRSVSESTADSVHTTMSQGFAQEIIAGNQSDLQKLSEAKRTAMGKRQASLRTVTSETTEGVPVQPTVSVSMGNNILISEKREQWAVRILNGLLDAYPKGIRMDSEGGRLPLHTACAGRATPQVVSTLITAYPAAARHRNKDGFLPLHLAAHWGISHPNVAVALLKAYPDATFGRNRWERTPLEEALCMAGENGRPFQAALVRSLRKHPSYWTRPADIFQTTSPRSGNKIVDMDETLGSYDESTEDGGPGQIFGGYSDKHVNKGRLTMFGKGRGGDEVEVVEMSADLISLIRDQNWDGVLARLEMNPEDAEQALKVTTRGGFSAMSGFTPLHYACERRPPVEVIDALVAACPRAAATRAMPGGALPLHVACTWYAPVEAINALLIADRLACKTQDELGNLALHSACFSGTSTQVVESLLRAYPKATLARNHQGSLPEEIIKRLKHDNRRSLMALVSLCKEEILSKREKKHRRNRSDGFLTGIEEAPDAGNPQNGAGKGDLMWV